MKNIGTLLLLAACVLVSCSPKDKYADARTFGFDAFGKEIKLEGKVLSFNDSVMRPQGIQVYDSVLITLEYGGGKLCHLFNLNTGDKIGERLTQGQGPDEMIMPRFMGIDGSCLRFFDMASSAVYKYDVADFIVNPDPKPLERVKLSENVQGDMQMLGENMIGFSYFKDHQLFEFNSSGEKIKEFAEFPKSSVSYSDIERADAFYMGFTTNATDKVAVCYYMTDLIEIYGADGALRQRIHGPEQFFAHFKELRDGETLTSTMVKGVNRDAYFFPQNAGDKFFVLYNGGYVDEENHSSSCHRLFSFSWDAVPGNIYRLDDPVFNFCVDKDRKKIYGISSTPEFHIVEYDYE